MLPYLLFQRCTVCSETPYSRQIDATVWPPAISPKIRTICSSGYRFFFMIRSSFPKHRTRILSFRLDPFSGGRSERLWRSVKYEEVYLKDYTDVREAREGLGRYFRFYNEERLHQSLGYRTPAVVYAEPA